MRLAKGGGWGKRAVLCIGYCCLLCNSVSDARGEPEFAGWEFGASGAWGDATNWFDEAHADLPPPGYPTTNHSIVVEGGTVAVVSGSVNVAGAHILDGGSLIVSNGSTVTVEGVMNSSVPESKGEGSVVVVDGAVNLLQVGGAAINKARFLIGSEASEGWLDIGGVWGQTNVALRDLGSLKTVYVELCKGGLWSDGAEIAMVANCVISNAAQEVWFAGNWINPDGSTRLIMNGSGAKRFEVDGFLSLVGCTLEVVLDEGGVCRIDVGQDANLSNAVICVGGQYPLSNLPTSVELIRVPAACSIVTNEISVLASPTHGVRGSVVIEENRDGFDYLMFVPSNLVPSVAIVSPADEDVFTSGTNVTIVATATDGDGTIALVEFFAGTNKLGEVSSPPYSMVWTNVLGGEYELRVLVTDNDGNVGTSPVSLLGVSGATDHGTHLFITGGMLLEHDAPQ